MTSAVRLGLVNGYDGRKNEIVYATSLQNDSEKGKNLLVFYPGDIQNYSELMGEANITTEQISRWNLEAVANHLSERVKDRDVLVIKPSRTENNVFNFYDNFVTTNSFGAPEYMKGRTSLLHIICLIAEVVKLIVNREFCQASEGNSEDSMSCGGGDDNLVEVSELISKVESVSIVGFSKGCVVLNQFVTEIFLMSELPEDKLHLVEGFLSKVTEMAWLDGGHQGREGTWITNPNFIRKLFKQLPQLHITIHVTPYQLKDKTRPWIGNEARRFLALCQAEANDRVTYTMHGSEQTLETHFLALYAYDGHISDY